ISDGERAVVFPGCRLASCAIVKNSLGTFFYITLQDRRWRWPAFGAMFGCYNQRDRFNKVRGWTAHRPLEMITACLQALGETNYLVNLPDLGTGTILGTGDPQPGGVPVAGAWPA